MRVQPANDYTSPGEDLLEALRLALSDHEEGDSTYARVMGALSGHRPWAHTQDDIRAIFEQAAVTFLSEP